MTARSRLGINPPLQKRSRETLDRILQATRELLQEKTLEELTIQQIAARADCSVGTFYGRFRDKEAILPHLLVVHYAEMEQEVEELFRAEAWDGATLELCIGAVVDYLAAIAQRQPGLIRALVLRNNQRPDSIPASVRASAKRILDRLHALLLGRRQEMNHPAAETAVEVGLLMVVAALRERLVWIGATHAASLSVANEVLIEELKHALLAYLTTSRSRAGRT